MADPKPQPSNQDLARQQIGMLPFGSLIGGPLNAAVEAQANAATTSLEFIKSLTETDDKKVLSVTFKYKNGDDVKELEVPLISIVPIPFLRIDSMDIGFKANVSATNNTTDSTTKSDTRTGKMSVSANHWFVKASLDASVSSKKDSTSTRDSKYSVEYTMDINVHAVQDDMPAGLAKVLNILTESVSVDGKKTG
jgi:hypothetical protein